jgi:hypothetical protein
VEFHSQKVWDIYQFEKYQFTLSPAMLDNLKCKEANIFFLLRQSHYVPQLSNPSASGPSPPHTTKCWDYRPGYHVWLHFIFRNVTFQNKKLLVDNAYDSIKMVNFGFF